MSNPNSYFGPVDAEWVNPMTEFPPVERTRRKTLSEAAQNARKPPSPADMLEMKHDSAHKDVGRSRLMVPAGSDLRKSLQQAVNEIAYLAARRDVKVHGYGCNDDLITCLEIIKEHTGITHVNGDGDVQS